VNGGMGEWGNGGMGEWVNGGMGSLVLTIYYGTINSINSTNSISSEECLTMIL